MPDIFRVNLAHDGSRAFIAQDRIAPPDPIFGQLPNNEEGRGDCVRWAMQRFVEAVRDKVPEMRRMRVMERYYSGFHWEDPLANRENAVRNFAFATVETIVPILIETKPRPQIMPRRDYGDEVAKDLDDVAQWMMDSSDYDLARYLGERDKSKYGWCVYMLQTDDVGICRPLNISPWDFYKDAAASCDDEMEHYFIARPVSTDWLVDKFGDQEKYPWLFDESGACTLLPDNIVSPSYDVFERPYLTAYTTTLNLYFEPENIVASIAHFDGEAPTATTSLVRVNDVERRKWGRTSFLIQMFVRDHTRVPVHYTGTIAERFSEDDAYTHTPSAMPYVKHEAACPSGWRVIQFLADGTFLDSAPLDDCYLGRNVELGRAYQQHGRFYGPGDLDHIVPVIRSINRRITVLNRALEFEAVPILLADEGAGTELDNRSVEPGDTLRKQRGSDIRWLDFRGVGAQQFEMLALEKMDMDTISGVHDVTEGRRPEGIEAAAAIRSLQAAAQTRIRGKEVPSFIEHTRILKKMMVATSRKCKTPIYLRASNGELHAIDPAKMGYAFDIRFAEGSGTVIGREAQEQKVMMMMQSGLIDQQSALERLNIKNVDQIMQRLQQQAAAQTPEAPPSSAADIINAIAALVKADPSGVAYPQIQQALAKAQIKPQPMDASQQHLEVARHAEAEKNAAPDPAPVIAGNGKGANPPRKG